MFFISFILSLLISPLLLLMCRNIYSNSSHYYISNFEKEKIIFERIVEIKTEVFSVNDNELEILQTELLKKCRVDSIDLFIENEGFSVDFYLSDSTGYPSIESAYRAIVYFPYGDSPGKFSQQHYKRISDDWYFVTNINNTWLTIIVLWLTMSVSIIWCVSVLKIIKFVKTKLFET